MKILQISSVPVTYPGGTEKVVWEISKRLAKENEVAILQTNLYDKESKEGISSKEGVKIITFPNEKFLGGYGYSKKAIGWLRKNYKNYDVIHSHGYNRYLNEFALYHLKEKVPLVFTPHGFIHTKKNYFFKIIHDMTIGKFLRHADFCTALTPLDFKYYKKLGIKKDRIIEIPNGIDIKEMSKVDKKDVEKFKKKYNLKNTLLHVGRIHESKGLQYLVKCLKNLDCRLLIVGKSSKFKKELEELIKKLGVEEKVIFAGALNEKDKIIAYHAGDIFVLFSEWEGFGITVIEAMASGKPVIVSDRGSLPFLVENSKDGIIVPFKNEKILENKIKFLLRNGAEAKKIGMAGKRKSKNYDWKNIVNEYFNLYKRAKEEFNRK